MRIEVMDTIMIMDVNHASLSQVFIDRIKNSQEYTDLSDLDEHLYGLGLLEELLHKDLGQVVFDASAIRHEMNNRGASYFRIIKP
jgi:hypothetical protein